MVDHNWLYHRSDRGDQTPGMYPPRDTRANRDMRNTRDSRDSTSMSRSLSAVSLSRSSSAAYSISDSRRPFSPVRSREEQSTETRRLNCYRLNVPEDDNEVRRLQLRKDSPFYATNVVREVRTNQLLPYRTETIREQYRYLCHIVTHIYIAIKSLDLKGNISIGVSDLDRAKNALMTNQSLDDFISQQQRDGTNEEGAKFETLAHTESEAAEDDKEQGSDDSSYDSEYDSDDDESMFASTPVSKVENKSASIISLKYWTKELQNLLRMGLVMPATLSASLVRVFYAVALSRGQNIDVDFYTDVIMALVREKEVLLSVGLRLDWMPIYKELEFEMVSPNASSHIADDLRFKRMVRFALTVNFFFDGNSVPLIMKKIMGKYSNQTVAPSFIQMAVLLPPIFKKPYSQLDGSITYDEADIRHYLPLFFSCWSSQSSNREVAYLISVIANISQRQLVVGSKRPELVVMGRYGVFTQRQFQMLLTQLAITTRVSQDERQAKYVKLLVDIIVHSLTSRYALEKEGIMDYIKTFCDSVRTLVHPSNVGSWSAILSRVIKRFATAYHRRLLQEGTDKTIVAKYSDDYSGLRSDYRLSPEVTHEFIETFMPLILFGVQSKSDSQRRRYIVALKTLCFIAPHQVLDSVLLDIYTSFDSVNSTHRINVILREVTALSRFMVQLPVYRVHIPRLLLMLVSGVDSNDPQKTILTTGLVKVISLLVPFADLTESDGDGGLLATNFTDQHLAYLQAKFYKSSPRKDDLAMADTEIADHFVYDQALELDALKSATSSFSEFIKQFCHGCFKYLENTSNEEGDDNIEARASALIPRSFDVLIESLNDELFEVLALEFFNYISNNVKHTVALVFSNIAELIVRRDPASQLPRLYQYLMPQIRQEIAEGAGVSRTQDVLAKDARIVWDLKLLSGVCMGAGSQLVSYLPDLQKFLLSETSSLKGEAAYCVSLVANSLFTTISCTRPLEKRLISQDWLSKNGGKITEACWGGFQFSQYRFDGANLQFQWYQPTSNEIDPLADTFEIVCKSSLDHLDDLMAQFDSKPELPLEVIDSLTYHINVIDGAVTGICTLFDPSFRPHMLEPAKALSSRATAPYKGSTPSLSTCPSTVSLVSMAGSSSMNTSNPQISSPPPSSRSNSGFVESRSMSQQHSDDMADNVSMKYDGTVEHETSMEVDVPTVDDYIIPDSEMPSGVSSPKDGEYESIDSSLTNRSSSLYSFGYYFQGNTFTKLSDPSYIKIHTIRERIGHTLDRLCKMLMHQEGGIDLMSNVIQAISDWLKNCGYFSSNNPVYIDNIQITGLLDSPGVNMPYTRTIFGARSAIAHCNRMSLSRYTRLPTDTDRLLIDDLVNLSASSYKITSYHASGVLTSSLNHIMNCTHLVFGIFKQWESALVNKDEEKLQSILRLFSLKKFRGLAVKNEHQLKKYEDLLVRSINFDKEMITAMALKLYNSIRKYIRIPAKVCIMNFDLVDSIRPPDSDIDLRISALKLAKEAKKKKYFALISKLVSRTIRRTAKHMYWKLLLESLELISYLHTQYEVPLNSEVLKTLAKSVNGIHPLVSKKCIIWIASVLDTLMVQVMYGYDLNKIMSVEFSEPDIVPLSTLLTNPSSADFFASMQHMGPGKFYIDNKFWVPTYSWNKDMKVIDGGFHTKSLDFNNSDDRSVRRFGKFVSKSWIMDILKLHISESESTTAFLPALAFLISSFVILSLHGYVTDLKYTDLFDIVDQLYKKDDKATHLVVTEVFTGLIQASRLEPSIVDDIDAKISSRFESIVTNDITQSTVNIWKIFCWWNPSHIDMRRFPLLVKKISEFEIDEKTARSPFNTFVRVTLLKGYMSSEMNRYHDFDGTINRLFKTLAHPYYIVAERVAEALFSCLLYTSCKTFENFNQLMVSTSKSSDGMGVYPYKLNPTFGKCLRDYCEMIKSLRKTIESKTPQEVSESDYMYAVRGLDYLLVFILKTSHGALLFPYLKDYIIGFIFDLETMKDACQLININTQVLLYLIAAIRFTDEQNSQMVDLICNNAGMKNPTQMQLVDLVDFIKAYYMVHYFTISNEDRDRLVNCCIDLLGNKYLDVRQEAAKFFSTIVHTYVSSGSHHLIKHSIKQFKKEIKAFRKREKAGTKATSQEICEVHGATLGLGAIVEAFPYTTPPPSWLPKVLSILALKCSPIDGLVGRTAKDILSKFKKIRQDTWHIDSKFFTQEQLEDLEGVLWKSYFI